MILIAVAAVFLLGTNLLVLQNSRDRIYSRVDAVPEMPVGLVLGTSPREGRSLNPFFEGRMDAAAVLFKSGKVKKLLVSGDHGSKFYDEPSAMRAALIKRGVPAKAIVMDDAGFRTLDSIVRARDVFGLKRCILVSDQFHLPRAIYIADHRDLETVGFYAEIRKTPTVKPYVREMGARCLVWLDLFLLNRQPRYLGKPQPIRV